MNQDERKPNPTKGTKTTTTTDREGFREDGEGVIVVRRGFITVSLHSQTFE